MEKIDFKTLNEIIEDYINYLARYNPIFLYNIDFFYELSKYNSEFKAPLEKYSFKKINATESFKLVEEFYIKYYKEDIKELQYLFNSGVFNIYYVDELKEEKLYLNKLDVTFMQFNRGGHSNIVLPLSGNITDIHRIAHEIRHQLNQPKEGRNISNDTLTEALSMFDEILMLDYFKDRIDKSTYINLKKYYFISFFEFFSNVNLISKLVIVKHKLGYISIENCQMLFGNINIEELISDLNSFLGKYKSYRQIDAEMQNWYVFGLFLVSFMHQNYLQDPSYFEKIKELNNRVKNNGNIIDCLKVIGIDFYDYNIINILKGSLDKEIKDIKENVKTM